MATHHPTSPVGVIGLGLLGTALAERLVGAGFPTVIYNRSREKASPLEALGATWSENPLQRCERVVICLYTTDVVREVLQRLSAGLRPGQTIVDATTGDPQETTELGKWLAQQEIDYLESPIAASSEQTRQGKAMAFVSGPAEAYQRCRDLFDALTAQALYVGESGNAARMKLVNNLILGLNRAVLAEGLIFAQSMGLDPDTALGVLRQGNAYSGVMDTKGSKMLQGDFSPQAKLSQHAKDVRLMRAQAGELGRRLPLTELHLELLDHGEEAGLGELDNSAIIRVMDMISRRNAPPSEPR